MAGFWSDLFKKGAAEVQKQAADAYAHKGDSAHIVAQESAGNDLATIQRQYLAGLMANSVAQREIAETAAGFAAFANSLGYERARRGASEIQALANQMLANLQREAGGAAGGYLPGIPETGVATATLGLAALGAFLLFRKR